MRALHILKWNVQTFKRAFNHRLLSIVIVNSLPMKPSVFRYLPIVFALVFFLQGYFGNTLKSLTWDEPVFIASGYSYLVRHDFRLNPEAPPLLQHLQALPLLGLSLQIVPSHHPIWQKAAHISFAQHFVHANAIHIPVITQRARLPILLIGCILNYTIYAWGHGLYGPVPALFTSALAALSPNLLAHAKLATTDLGCAAFMFFAVYAFWCATEKNNRRIWILCGIITGLALLTKYTALLLGPIYLILGVWLWWRKDQLLIDLIKGALLITVIAIVVIGAGFNFSFNPMLYMHGLQKIYANAQPDYQFYLMGQVASKPFWYYHLAAFMLKTPVPMLFLVGIATGVLIRHPQHRKAAAFLLVPAFLMLTVSCFDKTNLGYRRILPALPFLVLFCGHALTQAPTRLRTIAVVALMIWSLAEAVRIYPHHLSYFNTVAGGPENGPYLLDDSNIDWGQDLPGLAIWQQTHPTAQPLNLLYFGNMPPEIYGVKATVLSQIADDILTPKPEYYAISAHNLVWFRKLKAQHGFDIDWLSKYTPIDRIGYSIYIYKFPESAQ